MIDSAPAPQDQGNPRYQLRAYEEQNACRAAYLIKAVATPVGDDPTPLLDRRLLIMEWGAKYPRHTQPGSSISLANRIQKGLSCLRAARIIDYDATTVRVLSPELLAMSADNLQIVEDGAGVALPPSKWARIPRCPAELRQVQQDLVERGAAQ